MVLHKAVHSKLHHQVVNSVMAAQPAMAGACVESYMYFLVSVVAGLVHSKHVRGINLIWTR